jgi:methionyl-tRNA synthetase
LPAPWKPAAAMKPFYITTPIYYVNDKPHIGHCYTTLLADVAARMQRLVRGRVSEGGDGGVFFLTGTDEHADKVVTSAAAHGVTPQAWADQNAAAFRRAFDFMGCAYDDFIRTTEARHKTRVTEYIGALLKTGDVYQGQYTGWYDAGQEEYVTETAAKENGYLSAINKRPLIKRTEPCYFFRLSKYQAALEAHITANPGFVRPESRRAEVLGRLRQGLNDVPISRPVTEDPATQWGIRIPGDDRNRIYVWIDALFNYLTTVDTPERAGLWPADVHLIGKDILWFHAVIWPALLMALERPLPGSIFGHGWWISEGQKMSKTLGNFIDLDNLRAYADRYSLDALRWYLATQGPLSGGDADFSHAKFVEVYNADLANGIGNSASRVSNMIAKYFDGRVPEPPSHDGAWAGRVAPHVREFGRALAAFELDSASRAGIALVSTVDSYINETTPFKLAKRVEAEPALRAELAGILYNCAEALRIASVMLFPAMPRKMAELWARWSWRFPEGRSIEEAWSFGPAFGLRPGAAIEKGEALFMRADPAEAAPAAR